MNRSATISPCGLYRFDLVRSVEAENAKALRLAGEVVFVLNNPSKADGLTEDPTSRRGIGYMQAWGFSRMTFVNTNPHRSTDPRSARVPSEGVLECNDAYIREAALRASLIVAAWGDKVNTALASRAVGVLRGLAPLYALDLSKRGIPRHPLMLKKSLRPFLWAPAA